MKSRYFYFILFVLFSGASFAQEHKFLALDSLFQILDENNRFMGSLSISENGIFKHNENNLAFSFAVPEFDKYITFSKTKSGKKVNAAIFAAFDAMFVQLSQALGASAAQMMAGEDI